MTKRQYLNIIIGLIILVLLVILPRVLSEFQLNIAVEIAFFALFAMSYNLLLGYGGLLSFGHAAYFGTGAYFTVFACKFIAGMPLLLAILIGGLAGGIMAIMVGFFCVRLSGSYFALLTLAFNQLIYAIALKWRNLTGGDDGIGLDRPNIHIPLVGELDMFSTANVYYVTIIVVLICLSALWFFLKTPYGNSIACVKDNEERAKFVGYNTFLSKLTLFTMAGFFAGIAGALFAVFEEFVSLDAISLPMGTEALFMTIIGGTGSFLGPVLGAGVFIYFTEWVSDITEHWEFFLGLLFVLLILYANKGLISLIPAKLKEFWGKKAPVGGES
ncbi:MAG: branched-chain amino acid ABC transporter permease [Deltaproteobacteria bacterium]|nr:branched-chain amino acid ABC transporter permease [Deltaproteobacteria bacterium]